VSGSGSVRAEAWESAVWPAASQVAFRSDSVLPPGKARATAPLWVTVPAWVTVKPVDAAATDAAVKEDRHVQFLGGAGVEGHEECEVPMSSLECGMNRNSQGLNGTLAPLLLPPSDLFGGDRCRAL